jgi:hypothetical protein
LINEARKIAAIGRAITKYRPWTPRTWSMVAETTEGASYGTPLIADTLGRFSSAAMP